MFLVKFRIYSINVRFYSYFFYSLTLWFNLEKILMNWNLLRLGPIAKSNRKGKRRFETEESRRMADHHLHASEANLCNAFIQDKAKVLAMQQRLSMYCVVPPFHIVLWQQSATHLITSIERNVEDLVPWTTKMVEFRVRRLL